MGLFNFIKKQLLEVIEYNDNSKNTLVYRYPLTERDEIMNSSTLVVRPSQVALFIHKGEIADVFAPGTYKLSSENIPFLTKLLSLPTGFNSCIKAEIYFVNTKQFTNNKWGTQNPIMLRDKDFGNVRLRGFGAYSFKVEDAKVFMKELFGTNAVYTTNDITEYLKPILIQGITDAVAESKISALDLAANYKEFANTVITCSQPEFSKIGIKLSNVIIENISLPEEVEKALDQRTKLGVLESKMGTYTQLQAAEAMRDAAKNPSGNNFVGLGMGLNAGGMLGKTFAENITTVNKEPASTCVKCGAEIRKNAKFCPECGSSQKVDECVCAVCNSPISKKAKFCPECGTSTQKTCAKCGTVLKKGAKFCPECGEKI